jgi:di/tricarboxylate transporter
MNLPWLVSALAICAAMALLISPPSYFSPRQSKAAALAIVTIGFWATGTIPQHLTALFFFLFAMLFSISPASVVFSGFGSTALWLIFGGLVIGVAITNTGLGKVIAGKVAVRLHGGYLKLIGGLVAVGILFAFLMPSAMGRVILLVPIMQAVTCHLGFEEGSNGRTGVFLAAILGSFIPAFGILPANVPNMVLAGMSETLFRVSPLYGEYLLLHFPILGLLKAVVIVGLILWFYPDQPRRGRDLPLEATEPLSENAKKLSLVLVLLLVLWMTDFVHHISPAWVALAGALFLLLPGIGMVGGRDFNEKINYRSLFFVAGILGLGGMVSHSGLGDTLAKRLIAILPFGEESPFSNYVSLVLISSLTGIGTTLPGVPAVMTPLAQNLSQVTNLPLKTILMTQVLGFSTFFFPYQAPPIAIGMQLAGERLSSALKLCLLLALVSFFLLLPLNYLWWRILGWM